MGGKKKGSKGGKTSFVTVKCGVDGGGRGGTDGGREGGTDGGREGGGGRRREERSEGVTMEMEGKKEKI